jgi:hypothetical protein
MGNIRCLVRMRQSASIKTRLFNCAVTSMGGNAIMQLTAEAGAQARALRELAEREAEREKVALRIQQAERTLRDVQNAFFVGSALARLLGSPATARAINGVGGAVSELLKIALFAETLGPLGVATGFMAAIDALLSIGAGDSIVVEALNQINEQLVDIRERLARIELTVASTYEVLVRLYEEVMRQGTQIEQLRAELGVLLELSISDSQVGDRDGLTKWFTTAMSNLSLAVAVPPAQRDPAWEASYRIQLRPLVDRAQRDAKTETFAGRSPGVARPLKFIEVMRTRRRVDLLMGLLDDASQWIGRPMPEQLVLANPLVWATGVMAYVETRTLALVAASPR